jgi:LysM repeat protein
MNKLYSTPILLVLLLGSFLPSIAQRKSSPRNATRNANHITAHSGETLGSLAARANLNADELAQANGLTVNSRLRKGQRLVLPALAPATMTPPPAPTGEIIGKRINFVDGGKLDVDDAWKQGDTTWFRLNGTSQSLSRDIRSIENRYKVTSTPAAAPTAVTTKVEKPPLATWIYLVDGARLRVDEVRQVPDGAWYNRGNVAIFLDKERISRIEREVPEVAGGDSKNHGWSSGNTQIDLLIRQNATRVGIDPYLVFLVIEQESHFHTRVVSPKGAKGLMQLMPGTARRFGVSQPFDAADNIRGGTQYLKELLTMFRGRVDLALASYNAGEGRVLDYGNRVPPFKETRDYVKRINSRYQNGSQKPTTQLTAQPR